ncbi:MAG: Na+/H+ antiporter [Acidobacteriota bacterium]
MELNDARTVLELLLIVVAFAVVARRLSLPYPIVMVIAGILVSLVPGLPDVQLDPQIIFHLFLPLLLYRAAWETSWPSLQRDLPTIVVLAVGLVAFTVFGIAAIAPSFLPGFNWQTAFILGAVIAPTDAIAATSIARRLRMRKQLVDILEEESLLNDATGLLAFHLGVAMLLRTDVPTIGGDIADFGFVTVAGIAIGLAVAVLVHRVERGIDDAPIVIASTVLVPFAVYFVAEAAHASGVLAVVACGLLHSRRSDESRSARVRLEAGIVWNTLGFLLSNIVFVLIGLQLREILQSLRGANAGALVVSVLALSAVVLLLRLLWVFPAMSFAALLRRDQPAPSGRDKFLIGWAGMHGVIALAAAMSLPRAFAQRPMIIFLTFGAIFVSVVIKGLTLPAVIRRLGLHNAASADMEQRDARRLVAELALEALESLHEDGTVPDHHYDHVKKHYETRLAALDGDNPIASEYAAGYRDAVQSMLQAERQAALRLRNERRISDEIARALLAELDLAETRMSLERTA